MSEHVPRLPPSVYTGIVGEYIALMRPLTQAPPEFLYAAFMAALGAGFPQVMYPWGSDQLPLTPYVLLYGVTGTKKSHAKTEAIGVVDEALRKELRVNVGTFTPEGASRILREASDVDMDFDNPLVNAKDPSVIFDVGEFTGLLKASQRQGNPLVELLLDAYSAPKNYSKTLSKQRDSLTLKRLRMAVIGDSTPKHLGEIMKSDHINSGLFNRLDIFMGERGDPVRKPGTPNRAELMKRVIKPLRDVQDQWTTGSPNLRSYKSIDLTKEADRFLDDVYVNEVYPSMEDDNAEVFARFDIKMQLYGVLHMLNEGQRSVTLAHITHGYEVATYLKATGLMAAGELAKSDKLSALDAIEEYILKKGPKGVESLRKLHQNGPKSYRDTFAKYGGLNKLVQQLVEDEVLEYNKDSIVHTDFTEGGER